MGFLRDVDFKQERIKKKKLSSIIFTRYGLYKFLPQILVGHHRLVMFLIDQIPTTSMDLIASKRRWVEKSIPKNIDLFTFECKWQLYFLSRDYQNFAPLH